ncbi:M20 family metallopeptidase [Candidatus Actinomarina sp.]|jgi:amidohydrolase|nr:M20 family metallopeptidase [Acidimicrobiia bacterium]MDA7572193.1 M20 family metallopeptidase [bacterium]MDA8812762.1 M20 family metallopeptidase [Candidatus Actinomarina sp.]MDA7548056.1 M20 family metallopeptidase [Acidimicrobiia bacterium]MDA7594969.1 M20 family metallopeptidase [Acidimicrobiia bacterium]|tara:strand:+ start:5209 stop:6351 length:1143 start_codon:yes stop_codon:yes gene_type:complete
MTLKNTFKTNLDSIHKQLTEVSDWMYENPELGFNEFKTSEYLVNFIESFNGKVAYPTGGLDTAFEVTYGNEGPLVVLCVEYDALPEIGHACGHNVIATASIGAGLAIKDLADELGIRVKLLGTPAEEGGGGKIILLENGNFEDAVCSMMIHPGVENVVNPTFTTIQQYKVEFFGKDAHAAGAPEQGINALDAQIQLFVNASTYRQQMVSTNRMHGVITNGGFKPNIIPSYTSSEWYLRALNEDDLLKIESDFKNFVNAAAMSTKCDVKIESPDYRYTEIDNNKVMYELYKENSLSVDRKMILQSEAARPGLGSTDMGNVSLAMPSIHPMLSIDSGDAVNHQPEYAAATLTPGGHKAIYDGAYAMGATIIDLAEKNLWSEL